MDTILDMTKVFRPLFVFVYFQQMLYVTIFFPVHVRLLHWHIDLARWCGSPQKWMQFLYDSVQWTMLYSVSLDFPQKIK